MEIPCGQGSVPPVSVEAYSVSDDVQAAVNFAKQHNLKLVVKNTGHDFISVEALVDGGFLIWAHFMKEILYYSTFVPESAPVITENTLSGDIFFWGIATDYFNRSAVTLELVFNGKAYDFAN